ncbi:MEKHLA domain-containing protein [Vibrio marisflavi]|uniref:MEKHLA domain-containing protein n=1 Tax=Vibrio marisflavi CECT 7928 TaxID=634439 RepID=A0ABN8DZN0_9VIBR|nr:MEKHLA domain-containing protein [Vibrio marisflavi]CAH0535851.1 hypothetical protein VMF7928_00017 [Vibrio marisflavi CECT 7928]
MKNVDLNNPFFIEHGKIIAQNYKSYFGHDLCNTTHEHIIQDLWQAPFAILSHGNQSDPIFNFGNETALKLFEMDFEDLTKLPSKYSAEPMVQEERDHLLQRVSQHGYIDDYCGIRIASTGRRFKLKNAIVFNLVDNNQQYYGQAAILKEWTYL